MSIFAEKINLLAPAPPFEAISTEGEHVKLSDLKGKLIVLEFGSLT